MNPYEVLGVSSSATKDEIHDAYRKLVKKYHPDKYTDPQMKKVAEEKIKQINEAYDLLKDGNYNTQRRTGSYTYNGGGSYYSTSTGSPEFATVRNMINSGNIQGAANALRSMMNRNAEWHFLMGVVYLRQGRYDAAREEMRTATSMDPGNAEYAQAYAQLLNYNRRYSTRTYSSPSACDCCTASLCLNCLCGGCDGNCLTCC